MPSTCDLPARNWQAPKKGRAIALDVKTGDYAIGDTGLEAADKLLRRHPKAEIWYERVGYPAFHKMGAWNHKETRK